MLPGSNRAAWADNIDYTQRGAMCRKCGYLLRELKENCCPECGTSFDRHRRNTMKVPGYKSPRWEPTFGIEMMIASLLATVYWILALQFIPIFWPFAALSWLSILLRWRKRNRLPVDDPWRQSQPEGPRWRPAVKIMMLISIFFGGLDVCPHAVTVRLGPFGVSYSSHGGPCRNYPHDGGYHLIGNLYIAK